MINDVVTALNKISEPPDDEEAYAKWLETRDALQFLRQNCHETEFVAYATNDTSFIHSVLVPTSLVSPPDYNDISQWHCDPTSCWGIDVRLSEPRDVWIAPPLNHTGTQTLNAGEQLIFRRRFEGLHGKKGYFEILQKFLHVFDLHRVEERASYCRLDQYGDLEDMIRMVEFPGKGDAFGASAVVINRELLDEYMVLTQSVVVRMFDFMRLRMERFNGWRNQEFSEYEVHEDLCYRAHVEPGHGSFLRGFHLLPPAITKAEVLRRNDYMQREACREYASFIAYDWKNKVVREVSTAPGATANYFTKSDLPFETTPAFFRPEVLLRYKFDSEKYTLESRSISCRGGWSLRTFDVNEASQVHTYIVYLRDLPYEEQLHWKAHNEKPKAPISRRALTTDFEGNWYSEYDALSSLQEILHQWYTSHVPWWTLRSEKLIEVVHYPVTASPDEWSGELLRLDQLITEGFETKWLREKAQSLGRKPDPSLASLKLLEECLLGRGFESRDAAALVEPLKETHSLRSKMKGHASGQEAVTIRKKLLKEHGSFKAHFVDLCKRCDESIRSVGKVFESCLS
jgi:hypothetical protein